MAKKNEINNEKNINIEKNASKKTLEFNIDDILKKILSSRK